jgi:heme O synthase-like polyprenyltransferase
MSDGVDVSGDRQFQALGTSGSARPAVRDTISETEDANSALLCGFGFSILGVVVSCVRGVLGFAWWHKLQYLSRGLELWFCPEWRVPA